MGRYPNSASAFYDCEGAPIPPPMALFVHSVAARPEFRILFSCAERWNRANRANFATVCCGGIYFAFSRHVRRCLWLVSVFVAALFQVQAAPTALAEFSFQFREGLIWVEVTVPRSEKPLNFLLDTGAGCSVINLSTAKRIGLKLGREVTVHSVRSMMPGYWQERLSAKAGDVGLPSDYLAVGLEQLSTSCGRPVDGLIGEDFFKGRVVEIDFDAAKVRLLKPQKSKDVQTLPLDLRACGMRVPISVNGHKRQWVRLDTGCATPLQWVTSDVRPEQCIGRRMAIGLVEVSIPQTETAVVLGDHAFEKVPTGLHQEAIFPGEVGLLGNGLLSRFSSITIDAKAGRLIFGPRHPAQ